MHVLSLAFLLAAAQTPGAGAPRPAASPPAAPAPSPVSPPAAPYGAAPVLSRAAIEKIGQGDRAYLDRNYRNALFAYMDAAYLAPGSAAPRVKLARAYLALRYPERAAEQAERALALEPGNAEAKKLLDEARSGGPQAAPPRTPAPAAPIHAAPAAPAAQPAARAFRFVPEPEAAAAPARATPAARAEAHAPAAAPEPAASPEPARAPAPGPAPSAAAQPQGATAADRYRQAIELLQNREFDKAIVALDEAVALDPRLAVAYAARASARFGLGAYREAADDYRKASSLDAKLATPLYGLAECHRVLGQPKEAAEMYRRYAESRASDVREDLRAIAVKRAQELR